MAGGQEEADVDFRRLVSNVFCRLSRRDVQQIAYVRLKGKEDTKKYSASNTQDTSLDLMESLEQYDYFSKENVEGLTEILKDANRSDLAKHVAGEVRKQRKKNRKNAERPQKDEESAADDLLASPTEEKNRKWDGEKEYNRWKVLPEHDQRVPPLHLEDTTSTTAIIGVRSVPSNGSTDKKIPLLPPHITHKRVSQETSPPVKVTTGQQLVTLHPPQSPSLSLARKSDRLSDPKPLPPPRPPKPVMQEEGQKSEKEGWERDSGMWTGSAYDSPVEWTKHHPTQPKEAGISQGYQHLMGVDCENQYSTPTKTN